MSNRLVIANMSGFYGDRLSAASEMVRGGPIDVLTGDYLAELTMAILHKPCLKHANGGYMPTFLRQMEEVLGDGAASTRFDPQAKTLAEYFRARHVDVPRALLVGGERR